MADNLRMARQGTSFYDTESGQSETQVITLTSATGGAWTATFDGQTTTAIDFDATANEVEQALFALSSIGTGKVSVTGSDGGPYTVEFTGSLAHTDVGPITVTDSTTGIGHAIAVAAGLAVFTGIDLAWGSDFSTGNETQTVTLSVNAGQTLGGTFTLTYSGQTTSALAYNATAATVATALKALSNVGDNDVSVSGGAGGPYTVTFKGALEGTSTLMTASGASLTGTGHAVTVTGGDTSVREVVYCPAAARSIRLLKEISLGNIEETANAVTTKPAAPWGTIHQYMSRRLIAAPSDGDTLTYSADLNKWVPQNGK